MTPGIINIVVLHAQAAQRNALCDTIADEGGFSVLGSSSSAAGLIDLVRVVPAHVLVLDLASVGDGALELLAATRAASPRTGILLLVGGHPLVQIEELMARGAGGYLETARSGSELAAALRTIGMGRRYLPVTEASGR